MPFQVSRTDTSQFVLMDPSTDTVVIDDDLAVGFAKLERIVAEKPLTPAPARTDAGVGGPRYTPVLLAVVLPFAWLAVLYLALANLLSEHALDRSSARETQTKIDELEREVQSLRSEISGAPRTAKSKPTKRTPEPENKQPVAEPVEDPVAKQDADDEQPVEGIR